MASKVTAALLLAAVGVRGDVLFLTELDIFSQLVGIREI